jgi:ribosomal protein L7/L12
MEMVYVGLGVIVLMGLLASYADTSARVRRIEYKVNMLLRHAGLDPAQGFPLSEQVKDLARDPGRKIEAIKVYREETGASLKDAKDAVEAFIEQYKGRNT